MHKGDEPSPSPVGSNFPATVYRTYEDGYVVRSMTPDDCGTVERWYAGMGVNPAHVLQLTMSCFPVETKAFYIGEFGGEVVASVVQIPWGDVMYLSLYYVDKKYRGRGFGARMKDEVAGKHIENRVVVLDSTEGKVHQSYGKLGFKDEFVTERLMAVAKNSYCAGSRYKGDVVNWNVLNFDKILAYDCKVFIANEAPRKAFLEKWMKIQGGRSLVAVDDDGTIQGYGCRVPATKLNHHHIGPLYADSKEIAAHILAKLCCEVSGDHVVINIWGKNTEAKDLMHEFGFEQVFECARMTLNGTATHGSSVFALTALEVCGF